MNGNPIYEQLNHAHELSQEAKDAKTLAEHKAIIWHYLRTGDLDKQNALEKYRQFEEDHPDYEGFKKMKSALTRNPIVPLEPTTDDVIVGNLNEQFKYLSGKDALEEWRRNG